MSRHHLISAILAGTALVITGAVFFYFARGESESVPSSIPREPQPQTDAWVELPCPKELLKLAQVPAHKRKAQCGRLSVPEAEGEARRTVEIGVVRLTPRDGAAKKPLLFLAGGPGDAFSYYLEKRLPAFGALAKGREILIVDQRGTGQGKPLLKCKRELKTREQLDSCFREWRADLDPGSFNTVQSARDLARVLDYHKIDKVAVYGVSYGTRLALAFSELYPARSERVLLDSPVAYVDVLSEAAKNAQAALARVLSACHDEARCKAAFPTSFEGLVTLVEAMDREGDGSTTSNSGNDFLYALSKLSLHPGVLPYVPYLIERARRGDQEMLNKLREASSSYQSSLGLHLSVQCAEFFAHTSPAAIRKGEEGVNPAFRRAFSTASYEDQCAGWAVPPLPPPRAPENLDVPVLVVSGAFDPVTPPEYGALLQKAVPRSRHVTIQSVAHGAVLSSCGALVGSGFMEGGLDASLPSCVDAKLTFETGPPDETRLQQILHEIRYRL